MQRIISKSAAKVLCFGCNRVAKMKVAANYRQRIVLAKPLMFTT